MKLHVFMMRSVRLDVSLFRSRLLAPRGVPRHRAVTDAWRRRPPCNKDSVGLIVKRGAHRTPPSTPATASAPDSPPLAYLNGAPTSSITASTSPDGGPASACAPQARPLCGDRKWPARTRSCPAAAARPGYGWSVLRDSIVGRLDRVRSHRRSW